MTIDTSPRQTAQAIEQALHQAVVQHQAGQLKQPVAGLSHFMAALAIARQQGLQGDEMDALSKSLEYHETDNPAKQEKPAGHKGKEPLSREKNAIVALFTAGRYPEVATRAGAMTRHFPRYGFGWKVLGVALKRMGKNADAVAPMQKAVELLPQDAEAFGNLGGHLQDLGRSNEAEEVLTIKPNDVGALCNLGITLQSLGRLDESLEHFQQRARLVPWDVVDQHFIASLSGKNTERAPAQYVEKVFDNYADKFDTHLQQGLQYVVPGKLLALLWRYSANAEKWDVQEWNPS